MMTLARLYEDRALGLPADDDEVFKLRAEGIARGSSNAQGMVKLGLMYAGGRGTGVDLEAAAEMMRKAIAHGFPVDGVQRARDWLRARGLPEVQPIRSE